SSGSTRLSGGTNQVRDLGGRQSEVVPASITQPVGGPGGTGAERNLTIDVPGAGGSEFAVYEQLQGSSRAYGRDMMTARGERGTGGGHGADRHRMDRPETRVHRRILVRARAVPCRDVEPAFVLDHARRSTPLPHQLIGREIVASRLHLLSRLPPAVANTGSTPPGGRVEPTDHRPRQPTVVAGDFRIRKGAGV